jgi:hypothetical protein
MCDYLHLIIDPPSYILYLNRSVYTQMGGCQGGAWMHQGDEKPAQRCLLATSSSLALPLLPARSLSLFLLACCNYLNQGSAEDSVEKA